MHSPCRSSSSSSPPRAAACSSSPPPSGATPPPRPRCTAPSCSSSLRCTRRSPRRARGSRRRGPCTGADVSPMRSVALPRGDPSRRRRRPHLRLGRPCIAVSIVRASSSRCPAWSNSAVAGTATAPECKLV